MKKQRNKCEAMKQEFNSLREEMNNKIAIFENLKQSVHAIHHTIREDVSSIHSKFTSNENRIKTIANLVGEVSKSQLELSKFNCASQATLAGIDVKNDSNMAILQNIMLQMKEKKDRDSKKDHCKNPYTFKKYI